MDIKEQITSTVEKITKDKTLMDQFQKNPIKTVEKVMGVDLPDDTVKKIIDGLKSKINVDKFTDALDGIKKLF